MNDLTPFSAVSAEDPYPYYARLRVERPFHRDEDLGMWVAAGARAVEAVLSNDVMRVRPPSEPVPKPIGGTPIAETFARLARMTDGRRHAIVKEAVVAALERRNVAELVATTERCADLLARAAELDDRGALSAYVLGLPALVVAASLGFAAADLSRAVAWTGDFVHSIAPGAGPDEIARGIPATGALRALCAERPAQGSLLEALVDEGRRRGIEADVIVANAIGFLFQSYDATAGLIGNTLVALATAPAGLTDAARDDADVLDDVIAEVARYDAPVQNTRRYAASDTAILGTRVDEGDAVLVLMAAANRDPSLNPDPDRFDPARVERRTYGVGLGHHACPGARMATTIARAGVARVLRTRLDVRALAAPVYRRSMNARVPDFAATAPAMSARSESRSSPTQGCARERS